MTRWRLIEPEDTLRLPWRNGRGFTRQLALWPEGARFEAGDFDWRISAAGVAEDGPFSTFEGFERVLVVTEGEGLVLDHGPGDGRARLRPLEPYSFSGAPSTHATLVAGPVHDLGVLTRRGVWRAEVEVQRLGARRARLELLPGEHGFVHVLRGACVARLEGEDDPVPLEREDSVWVLPTTRGADADLAGLGTDTLAVFVRLVPVPAAPAQPGSSSAS
jgi:environmental stress-induced protein Ves